MNKANVRPFNNLVEISAAISDNISVIKVFEEGVTEEIKQDSIEVARFHHTSSPNSIIRILSHIKDQLIVSYHLLMFSSNADLWIFFMADGLIIPMIVAKLLNKTILFVLGGNINKEIELKKDFLFKLLKPLREVNIFLSNYVVIYSPNFVNSWGLSQHERKIRFAHEHFINLDEFKIERGYNQRELLVGYIGSLSEVKGIKNFVKSIPILLKNFNSNELKFIIGGDGKLRNDIEKLLLENNLTEKVELVGWIEHDDLPPYMNNMRLLVVPSYSEGLPNILLEAMACGVPVLATPVGMIPEIIKDGNNGFLMSDNSPNCIAHHVIRALNHPNLEVISNNARIFIEHNFSMKATIELWHGVVSEIDL